ncbi:MAG: NUDIX domain-containing protein [Tepidisphaera sp.]|nr:NUDIX domain-containing protein [Tepidisphaera sp.]
MGSKTPHIEVIARGALFHGEHVLLCRALRGGYFYLPGGHVEFGETAAQAVARELIEEAALPVAVGRCLHVHEQIFRQGERQRHELNLLFHVELVQPAPPPPSLPPTIRSQESHLAFEWVALSSIAKLDLRPSQAAGWLGAFGSVRDLLATTGADWIGADAPQRRDT